MTNILKIIVLIFGVALISGCSNNKKTKIENFNDSITPVTNISLSKYFLNIPSESTFDECLALIQSLKNDSIISAISIDSISPNKIDRSVGIDSITCSINFNTHFSIKDGEQYTTEQAHCRLLFFDDNLLALCINRLYLYTHLELAYAIKKMYIEKYGEPQINDAKSKIDSFSKENIHGYSSLSSKNTAYMSWEQDFYASKTEWKLLNSSIQLINEYCTEVSIELPSYQFEIAERIYNTQSSDWTTLDVNDILKTCSISNKHENNKVNCNIYYINNDIQDSASIAYRQAIEILHSSIAEKQKEQQKEDSIIKSRKKNEYLQQEI